VALAVVRPIQESAGQVTPRQFLHRKVMTVAMVIPMGYLMVLVGVEAVLVP
jgi:hypothetical protein